MCTVNVHLRHNFVCLFRFIAIFVVMHAITVPARTKTVKGMEKRTLWLQ